MKRLFLILFLSGAFISPAFAYLDPGTGSIVVQAILGAVAVAGAALSVFWQKVRSFFSPSDRKKKK